MKHLIIISLFLVSCSSEWHLQRAIIKDPSILERDTLVIKDTVTYITEHIEKDTVFEVSKDTVIIEKNNLRIRHYIHKDSVYLQGECLSDTVKIEYYKEVPIEKIIYKGHDTDWRWWVVIGIGAILLFLVIREKFFK